MQIFTDDVNRAIDLVLQDNGRSLEEKRKDINAIKFQLVGCGVSNSEIVYDRNLYFGLNPIPKLKPKLADTFGQYRNRYRNSILKGESNYR